MSVDDNEQLTIAGELRNVQDATETVFDVIDQIGDDGTPEKRVRIGRRELQPELPVERDVARAKARDHEFHSIDAFCDYVERESDPSKSVGLADVERETIRFVLNEGDEFDQESISFVATTHPLFAPWKELIGQAIPVLEFSLFAMQNRSAVLEPDGRELALLFSQIKMSKTVTKRSGVGAKTLNGVMVETTIGSERREVEIDLPESIKITAPLYLDTDPVGIELDLLVTDTPDGVVVFLTAPRLQEDAFKVFQGFVARVRSSTERLVGLGRIEHRDWNLIGG